MQDRRRMDYKRGGFTYQSYNIIKFMAKTYPHPGLDNKEFQHILQHICLFFQLGQIQLLEFILLARMFSPYFDTISAYANYLKQHHFLLKNNEVSRDMFTFLMFIALRVNYDMKEEVAIKEIEANLQRIMDKPRDKSREWTFANGLDKMIVAPIQMNKLCKQIKELEQQKSSHVCNNLNEKVEAIIRGRPDRMTSQQQFRHKPL